MFIYLHTNQGHLLQEAFLDQNIFCFCSQSSLPCLAHAMSGHLTHQTSYSFSVCLWRFWVPCGQWLSSLRAVPGPERGLLMAVSEYTGQIVKGLG